MLQSITLWNVLTKNKTGKYIEKLKFPVGNAEISSNNLGMIDDELAEDRVSVEQEVLPELTPELSKKMQEFFLTG